MSTITGKRIARARASLTTHGNKSMAHGLARTTELDERITDLITDLHHLRHAAGLTVSETVDRMNTLLRIGADHFKIEVTPSGPPPVRPTPPKE